MLPRVQFVNGGVVRSSCGATEELIQARETALANPCDAGDRSVAAARRIFGVRGTVWLHEMRGTSRSLQRRREPVGGAVRRLGRLAGWDFGGLRNGRRGTAAPVCGWLAEPFGVELGSPSGTCLSRDTC